MPRDIIHPPGALLDHLHEDHRGCDNPAHVGEHCAEYGYDARRWREWLEVQDTYPIASDSRGAWWCETKRDWYPAIRYRVRVFLAAKRGWMRQVWMMKHFHPRHGQLFDDDEYRRAA